MACLCCDSRELERSHHSPLWGVIAGGPKAVLAGSSWQWEPCWQLPMPGAHRAATALPHIPQNHPKPELDTSDLKWDASSQGFHVCFGVVAPQLLLRKRAVEGK